ncbi:MAG: MFS transporter [Verrucomicrobia bacterium]|nr:MFS transporter [Verrucomicrobiota bacterium]
MNESSSWTALKNPIFRKLWIATVISGTCVAAHDSAATWMMNAFAASPFFDFAHVNGGVASLFPVHTARWRSGR